MGRMLRGHGGLGCRIVLPLIGAQHESRRTEAAGGRAPLRTLRGCGWCCSWGAHTVDGLLHSTVWGCPSVPLALRHVTSCAGRARSPTHKAAVRRAAGCMRVSGRAAR